MESTRITIIIDKDLDESISVSEIQKEMAKKYKAKVQRVRATRLSDKQRAKALA